MEISLVISHKVKCTFITQPRICNTGHLSQRSESLCPDRSLYKNIHSKCIHNRQKLETTKIYYNRWRVKQTTVVYPYCEIQIRNKKEWSIATHSLGGFQAYLCWVGNKNNFRRHILSPDWFHVEMAMFYQWRTGQWLSRVKVGVRVWQ